MANDWISIIVFLVAIIPSVWVLLLYRSRSEPSSMEMESTVAEMQVDDMKSILQETLDNCYRSLPILNNDNVDRCSYCRTPIWDNSRLCSQCGAPLPSRSGIITMKSGLYEPYTIWSHR